MRVLCPTTIDEACTMLAEERATPIAGATDLFVHWPDHFEARDCTYLDLSGLNDLRAIHWTDDTLTLGALTTYWDVIQDARCRERFPLLIDAARQVGAVQIQSRGTWAGNIVNASPAADGVPVLMAYDAIVTLRSRDGVDEIPLSDFYLGYKKMRRRQDQIIESILLPVRDHDFQVFEKVGSRRAQAIAKVGLAIAHSSAGWRIVVASMAETVRRCPSVEAILEENLTVTRPEDLLAAINADVRPINDIRSTAHYRETVLARLLYFDLKDVAEGFQ
jgi:CO/xanthine dehydrogenase FAD-binding subunit